MEDQDFISISQYTRTVMCSVMYRNHTQGVFGRARTLHIETNDKECIFAL